ncbi:hypothetical protein FS749_007527 [Ceratobasidium sp. UAMH 11750]|nr:hypothetical protein FS749_007527 [Ceratobasidium sp. UAMH 11750]
MVGEALANAKAEDQGGLYIDMEGDMEGDVEGNMYQVLGRTLEERTQPGRDSYPEIMHKLYSTFKTLDRLDLVRQDSAFATHEGLKVTIFDQVFIKLVNKQVRDSSRSSKTQSSPITHTQLQEYVKNPFRRLPGPNVNYEPVKWLFFQIKNHFRADEAPLYLGADTDILPQLWELATEATQ